MNIFYLSHDVKQCAKWHVDKHVRKMILETTQLLSNALHANGIEGPMRPTWMNHPCSKWARERAANWEWLRQLGLALCEEYERRFGKVHARKETLRAMKNPLQDKLPISLPPQVMPIIFRKAKTLDAYHNYYANGKVHLHNWRTRNPPPWLGAWKRPNALEEYYARRSHSPKGFPRSTRSGSRKQY